MWTRTNTATIHRLRSNRPFSISKRQRLRRTITTVMARPILTAQGLDMGMGIPMHGVVTRIGAVSTTARACISVVGAGVITAATTTGGITITAIAVAISAVTWVDLTAVAIAAEPSFTAVDIAGAAASMAVEDTVAEAMAADTVSLD